MKRYDVTWDSYDQQYAEEQDAKYKAVLKTLNTQAAYNIVLDVGCGSGLFFSKIADKSGIVIGVDITRNLIVKAKNQAKQCGNAHVIQADADHLPFKIGVFDAVFCFTVLQNMPKPKETLLEFKRHAQREGKIVVTGLKKAFELTAFLDLFEKAKLSLTSFVDDDALQCYVAVASPC